MKPFKHRSVVLPSTVILMRKLFKYKLTWLGIDSLNVKLLITEMVFQLSPCSCNANRPFSGARSGENLLLRWTSYQTSHSEKHSFYGTLVGKLQQKD